MQPIHPENLIEEKQKKMFYSNMSNISNMNNIITKKNFIELNDELLKKNEYAYDLEQIEYSLNNDAISLRVLVRTQKLNPYICAKYVIFGGTDEKYAFGSEDAWISTNDIPYYQTHITLEEIQNAHRFVANEELNEDNEIFYMNNEDIL